MVGTTYSPNKVGHNHIPFGALYPGVSNFFEADVHEYDQATEQITGPKDLRGWTDFSVKLYRPGSADPLHRLLAEVPAVFCGVPEEGGLKFDVDKAAVQAIVPIARRGGLSIDGKNTHGKVVRLVVGSWYIGEGAI